MSRKDWVFSCEPTSKRRTSELRIYDIAGTPIVRHVKVEGNNSPDDPTLKEYWLKRSLKANKTLWDRSSKYDKIAKDQGYRCPICNDWLRNGEELETHHIIPVKEGGRNLADNLIHLHKACHKLLHGKKTKQKA